MYPDPRKRQVGDDRLAGCRSLVSELPRGAEVERGAPGRVGWAWQVSRANRLRVQLGRPAAGPDRAA